jgi:hypothetical protein
MTFELFLFEFCQESDVFLLGFIGFADQAGPIKHRRVRRPEVIEVYIVAAAVLVAVGIMSGVLAVVSLSIHRDERAFRRHMEEVKSRTSRGVERLISKHLDAPELTGSGLGDHLARNGDPARH